MDRREILSRIRTTLAPNGIGRFCFVCGSAGVHLEEGAQGEVFVCDAHGHRSPRAFLFDGRAVYTFEDNELIHEVAGAVIRRTSGDTRQTLLFLRRKFPFQYTIPAGHTEIGMQPEAEMRREVAEETGLMVQTGSPLWTEGLLLKDACRRGADFHRWHVFEVAANGTPRLSDEGRIIGWYLDDEIQQLARQDMLTTPARAIFAGLGVLNE